MHNFVEMVIVVNFISVRNLMNNNRIRNFRLIGKETIIKFHPFLFRSTTSVIGLEESGSDRPRRKIYTPSFSNFPYPWFKIGKKILFVPCKRIFCIPGDIVVPFYPFLLDVVCEIALLSKTININVFFPERTLRNLFFSQVLDFFDKGQKLLIGEHPVRIKTEFSIFNSC